MANVTLIRPSATGWFARVTLAGGFTDEIDGLSDFGDALAWSHMHLTRTHQQRYQRYYSRR